MVQEERPLITSTAVRELITIYSCGGSFLGSAANEFLNRTVYFHDVMEMLAVLEQTFDLLSFPQSTSSYRSFGPRRRRGKTSFRKAGVRSMEKIPTELEKGSEKASFLVHVQFRQHSTWQGNITWLDKGVTQQFRSALEMLRLMNEALGSDGQGVSFEDGKPFLE